MARCSPVGEGGRVVEVEDMDEVLVVAELERACGENPVVSPDGEEILSRGVSDDEKLRMYYFWVVDHHCQQH
jgi:hypothetical protein